LTRLRSLVFFLRKLLVPGEEGVPVVGH